MEEFQGNWRDFAKKDVVVKTQDGEQLKGTLVSREDKDGIVLQVKSKHLYFLPFTGIVWIRVDRH